MLWWETWSLAVRRDASEWPHSALWPAKSTLLWIMWPPVTGLMQCFVLKDLFTNFKVRRWHYFFVLSTRKRPWWGHWKVMDVWCLLCKWVNWIEAKGRQEEKIPSGDVRLKPTWKEKKSGAQRFDPDPQQRQRSLSLPLLTAPPLLHPCASTAPWSRWEMKLAGLRDKDLSHALTPDATLTDFTAPRRRFKAENDVTNQWFPLSMSKCQ